MAKKLISYDDEAEGLGLPDVVDGKMRSTFGSKSEADHAHERISRTARAASPRRPLISIIDDDGNAALLSVLRPIAESRGIPVGAAVMMDGSSPVVENPELRAELTDLQDNHGWEILSHTYSHINIGEVSPEEYEEDCKAFYEAAHRHGFKVDNIVYPWGQESDANKPITARYYSGGFSTNSGANSLESTDVYAIRRVGLGSMMGSGVDTLPAFKTLIDEAKATKSWIVFMTHIGAADDDGIQLVKDVLDYAIEQNIDFASPRDGIAEFGALVQSGRPRYSDGSLTIRPQGFIESTRYFLTDKPPSGRTETSPPIEGTHHRVSHWHAVGWSVGSGYVTEYGLADGWSVQHFYTNNGAIFTRVWVGSAGEWSAWREFASGFSVKKTTADRVVPANSTVNVALYDSVFLASMTYAVHPAFDPPAGLVWTYWITGNGALKLRFANVTSEPLTMPAGDWRVRAFRR